METLFIILIIIFVVLLAIAMTTKDAHIKFGVSLLGALVFILCVMVGFSLILNH